MAKPKNDKWRFAVGTTSRVPNRPGMHYLILDFDGLNFHDIFYNMIQYFRGKWHAQATQRGWHVYTNASATFEWTVNRARRIGADPAWLRIGEKRGYLFLADKGEMPLPWPVERMVIARGEKIPRRVQVR